jgi:hypothetical protein
MTAANIRRCGSAMPDKSARHSRAETIQPNSGVEAVSFSDSCMHKVICSRGSMEAGSRGLSRSATAVVSISRSRAQDKDKIRFGISGSRCLLEVCVSCPSARRPLHHLLRLSPCACHKPPIAVDISSPVCTVSILCGALSYHSSSQTSAAVLLSHWGEYRRHTEVHEHNRTLLSHRPHSCNHPTKPPDLLFALGSLFYSAQLATCLDSFNSPPIFEKP